VEKIDGAVVETEELDVETGRENGRNEAGDEVRRKEGSDRRNVFELWEIVELVNVYNRGATQDETYRRSGDLALVD
jgi:hypothetical protein